MPAVPTTLQLDLFRLVEDLHDMTQAVTVLLADAAGDAVAISGDEDDIPPAVRAVLGGRALAEAGSVRELLSTVGAELTESRLNLTVLAVPPDHLLAIAFDSSADLATVQAVGDEARNAIVELLRDARQRAD